MTLHARLRVQHSPAVQGGGGTCVRGNTARVRVGCDTPWAGVFARLERVMRFRAGVGASRMIGLFCRSTRRRHGVGELHRLQMV